MKKEAFLSSLNALAQYGDCKIWFTKDDHSFAEPPFRVPHLIPHHPPTSISSYRSSCYHACLVFCSSSLTTVQSIFSSIISTDQFNGTIRVRQSFTHSLVKMEKRGTWPRSWGQKRRPKGNPNPRKGPLGALGPLKENPSWHNAILVSCRGGVLFSNQTFKEGSPPPALEDASHVDLTVSQPLSHTEYF